ncbi:hypothetical protein H9P43_009685 [Blastocladiella emersonii ATCC 22665]|nr:hypothetical protein H9P43_009685 [Blastocladiella emersonii ATCC 22665]
MTTRDTVSATSFLGGTDYESGKQRSMWVAAFTALVVWMAMLLMLYLVAGSRKRQPATSMARPVEGRPLTEVTTVDTYEKASPWGDKFRRAVRAARLTFLMVFSTTVITALGFGPTGGTVAILWVAFAIGALWSLAELFTDSHWMRLVMSLMLFPLVIITWALAFRSRID